MGKAYGLLLGEYVPFLGVLGCLVRDDPIQVLLAFIFYLELL